MNHKSDEEVDEQTPLSHGTRQRPDYIKINTAKYWVSLTPDNWDIKSRGESINTTKYWVSLVTPDNWDIKSRGSLSR